MAERSNRKRLRPIPTNRSITVNCLGPNITFSARRQGYKFFFVQGFIHDICFNEPSAEEVGRQCPMLSFDEEEGEISSTDCQPSPRFWANELEGIKS